MTPDQATFLLHFLLPQLRSEQSVTRKIISSIPPDRSDFKPDTKSMSAFKLAWHIALCELWFLDAIIDRHFGEGAPMPPGMKTCAEVAEWYDTSFTRRIPLLEALSGEDLTVPVDYIGLRNDPAVAYLNIAIRHSVHHRGQLSTYLRCMGARVPAIYVESADEPYPPEESTTQSEPPRPPAF